MVQDWVESHVADKVLPASNGREIHFDCPFCTDTRKRMYLNLSTNKIYCHNCQAKGTILNLIQFVNKTTFEQAKIQYKEIVGTQFVPQEVTRESLMTNLLLPLVRELDKRPIPLPESLKRINPNKPTPPEKRAIKYLNSRGVTNKQIVNCGMAVSLESEWKDRVIIPIIERGQTTFYVGRAISKNAKLKEKSPSNEDFQISKSEVIFNLDKAVAKYGKIIISEGIFDALSFGDIGVSLLGKVLYQDQLNKILEYKDQIDEVFIALDWDAHQQATEMAEVLSEWFKVSIVNIPKKLDDPNNVLCKKGRELLFDLVEDAQEYSPFVKLQRKLRFK